MNDDYVGGSGANLIVANEKDCIGDGIAVAQEGLYFVYAQVNK